MLYGNNLELNLIQPFDHHEAYKGIYLDPLPDKLEGKDEAIAKLEELGLGKYKERIRAMAFTYDL